MEDSVTPAEHPQLAVILNSMAENLLNRANRIRERAERAWDRGEAYYAMTHAANIERTAQEFRKKACGTQPKLSP